MLVRYPDGVGGEFFFQRRAPANRPDWLDVATIRFPSGNVAQEVVPREAAALAWMANLGCIELHPHPVRADDLDHPDELRVDLDPVPGVDWKQIREVAAVAHEVLDEHGLVGWPKTSGSRGVHIIVRIERPGSPPASGGRKSATACSSTTTRTPRTGPWPRPTRCGPSPMGGSRRR